MTDEQLAEIKDRAKSAYHCLQLWSVRDDRDALLEYVDTLRSLVASLAERVHKQSELLSRRAERANNEAE